MAGDDNGRPRPMLSLLSASLAVCPCLAFHGGTAGPASVSSKLTSQVALGRRPMALGLQVAARGRGRCADDVWRVPGWTVATTVRGPPDCLIGIGWHMYGQDCGEYDKKRRRFSSSSSSPPPPAVRCSPRAWATSAVRWSEKARSGVEAGTPNAKVSLLRCVLAGDRRGGWRGRINAAEESQASSSPGHRRQWRVSSLQDSLGRYAADAEDSIP